MKRIGSFLIVAALIAAMAGCSYISPSGGGDYGESYTLTTISTAGGSVATPGEGTFTYAEGAVVNLLAQPEEGYQFVNWTGNVSTIANVNSAITAITANDSYSIRANFLEGSSIPLGINYTEAEVEQLIIVLVNAERQQYDLGTLSEDALLTSLAREHSISMVENDFFGHERYPGERPLSYNMSPGTMRGENLAKIPTRQYIPGPYLSLQEVCEWAVSGWMDSPGHRANILEPRYTETGVGVSFSDGWDYLYITQIFEGVYY
ncbi:MAG TPA: CAP domain-containing protein [Dehalococcoidia bacterium]|nr:CAP domain-containing protein [Dehalococcoidia bacterium]